MNRHMFKNKQVPSDIAIGFVQQQSQFFDSDKRLGMELVVECMEKPSMPYHGIPDGKHKKPRFDRWKSDIDGCLNNVTDVLSLPLFDFKVFNRNISGHDVDKEMQNAKPKLNDDTRIAATTWRKLKQFAMRDDYYQQSWFVSKILSNSCSPAGFDLIVQAH